jgi:hypothetical protein
LVVFDDEHTHSHSMPPGGHSGVTTYVTGPAPVGAYNGAMNKSRLNRSARTVALAGLTAVLVAACGGSKKPPASNSGGTTTAAVRTAYRYAACMRTHGVTNFQDPHVSTQGNSVAIAIRVNPAITGSPAFKSAQRKCGHILPIGTSAPNQAQTRSQTDAILAFAKCMREHGFPKFPDPNSQGQLTPAMLSQAGIKLQQPAIKPAAYACLPLTHGILTKADINQAIANPNGGSQSASAG